MYDDVYVQLEELGYFRHFDSVEEEEVYARSLHNRRV